MKASFATVSYAGASIIAMATGASAQTAAALPTTAWTGPASTLPSDEE